MKESAKELALISENISLLYEDGIELSTIFDLLLELPISKRYKKSLINIKEDVLEGSTLYEAFDKHKNLYPDFFTGVINLGESSGELAKSLMSLSDYYSSIYNLKRNVVSTLIYPVLVMSALILFMIFSFFLIIPNLYEAFSSVNDKGGMIKNIYLLNRWIVNKPIVSSVFVVSWGISLILLIKFFKSKDKIFGILLKIDVVKKYYEYIFVLIFSVIINSGTSLAASMNICIKSSNIDVIKKEFIDINKEVMMGNAISVSMKKSNFISKYTYSMVVLGEKSGSIDNVILKLEKRLKKNVIEKINKSVSYITPISIGVLAITIVIFIFLFIVPMLDMMYSGALQ